MDSKHAIAAGIPLLRKFTEFMNNIEPDERLWLIDMFNQYYCDKCGSEISECLCNDEEF